MTLGQPKKAAPVRYNKNVRRKEYDIRSGKGNAAQW